MDRFEPQTSTAATIVGAGLTKRHAELAREQSNVPDPAAIPLLSPGPQLIQPTQGSSEKIPKTKTNTRTLWSALSPGLIESLRTAWATDKTSCIQRGLCSAAQTLGDLLPSYLLTTGILQASQSNWLGAGLNLALALTTYVLGISAKLRDKYYSSKVANSLERHLEQKLHLSTTEILSSMSPVRAQSFIIRQHDFLKNVGATTNSSIDIIGQCAAIIGTAWTLAISSPVAAAAIAVSALYHGAIELYHARRVAAGDPRTTPLKLRLNSLTSLLKDSTADLSPVQIRSLSQDIAATRQEVQKIEEEREQRRAIDRTIGLPISLAATAIPLLVSVGLHFNKPLALQALIPIGALLFKTNSTLLGIASSLGSLAIQAGRSTNFFRNLAPIWHQKPTQQEAAVSPQLDPTCAPRISVSNLSYTFPDSKEPALEKVSLSLEPGSFTTIVGSHSSGKSLLLTLLAGEREPSDGTIALHQGNAHNLTVTTAGDLFRRFSSDTIFMRGFSINQIFRDFKAYLDPTQILDTLKRHGMDIPAISSEADLVRPMGAEFPNGIPLTDGMFKKVQLIAALASSAPVLLIDDPQDELSIEEARYFLDELKRKATTEQRIIVVTTREDILANGADKVLRLRSGRVIS